ncbi:lipopolysaccharide-induced tumor necrosis factor-alpha factor homolog [Cimex lectularius]|uniref:LITAF domain-containing protein n=1 Tax=Cimex lectularius TaxID=79782 RepID=A0A8I6R7S8_CIMLE|nr:lipopolysaccharide-induced tumor necrosis factor-alpha factor homolog [Cimex lectularius]
MSLRRNLRSLQTGSDICVIAPKSLERPLKYVQYVDTTFDKSRHGPACEEEICCSCNSSKESDRRSLYRTPSFSYTVLNMNYPKEAPPPYGMAVPPPIQPASVPQVVIAASFGPEPQTLTCPSCHTVIVTRVERESTVKTHILAGVICLLCCPLFWVPYCIDSCQATNHYCPKCGAHLGIYDR